MTKTERLFSLLTEVDDVLVEEAAQPFFPIPEKKHWGRWAALAACLLLVFGLARTFPFIGMGGSTADGEPMAPSASAPAESAPQPSCEPSSPAEQPNEGAIPGDAPPEASDPAAGSPAEPFPSSDVGSGSADTEYGVALIETVSPLDGSSYQLYYNEAACQLIVTHGEDRKTISFDLSDHPALENNDCVCFEVNGILYGGNHTDAPAFENYIAIAFRDHSGTFSDVIIVGLDEDGAFLPDDPWYSPKAGE